MGGALQPRRQSGRATDTACLAHQYKKGGLEHILRDVMIADDAPGHPQDHRPMEVEQGSERRLVPELGEPADQVRVGRRIGIETAQPLGAGWQSRGRFSCSWVLVSD